MVRQNMPSDTGGAIQFKNPLGFKKDWGAPEPAVLRAVFEHLIAGGFRGPGSWTDALHIPFEKDLSQDILARVIIGRVGEFPSGVFNFDTAILICSEYVGAAEKDSSFWGQDVAVVRRDGASLHMPIFSVTLSHLKWNSQPGANPTWRVTRDQDLSEAVDWSRAWDSFGKPFVARFANPGAVVDCLLRPEFLPRSSWVKSDGIKSAGKIEYAALLLSKLGKNAEAQDLLDGKLRELEAASPNRVLQSYRQRCERVKNWIRERSREKK